MVPVVSFVGFSGSGKTTLIERIIPRLRRHGLRVAVIKHAAHGFDLDQPGKDSWRFNGAGSNITVLTSPGRAVLMEQMPGGPELEAIIDSFKHKVDIVLVEGYKQAMLPKIEVRPTPDSPALPCPEEDLLAIIAGQGLPGKSICFKPEDINALVDLLTKLATSTLSVRIPSNLSV